MAIRPRDGNPQQRRERGDAVMPRLGVALVFVALSVWVFREVLWSPLAAVPSGADVLMYLWNCWHVDRALLVERVSPYFTRWIMYPVGTSLIFQTIGLSALVPWLPVLALVPGAAGVVAVYNAEILSSFVLAGIGAYALAWGETGDRTGAVVAGVLFSFSAHRLSQLGWADLLSVHYALFYLVCLLRTVRRAGVWMPLIAGVLLALVAYNSFTQFYLVLLLTPVLLVTERCRARFVMRRFFLLVSVTGLLIAPLSRVVYREYFAGGLAWAPIAPDLVSISSADPRDFLLPHHLPSARGEFPCEWFSKRCDELRATHNFLAKLGGGPLFVGSSLGHSLLVLAFAGAVGARREGAWRWIALGAACVVLSLGPSLRIGGEPVAPGIPLPYAWLRYLPGFAMSKNPDRFVMPAVLFLSVAAAFGVRSIAGWARGTNGRRGRAAVARAVVVGVVIAECCSVGPGAQPVAAAPFARLLAHDPGNYAVMYYPLASILDPQYGMWEQVTHEKRLLMGFLSRVPFIAELQADSAHRKALSLSATAVPVAEQIEALDALVREPRYRVKWLVVLHEAFPDQRQREEMLFHLSLRYPQVWRGRVPFNGLLERYRDQSVFYVGQPAFDATRRRLEAEADQLQTIVRGGSAGSEAAAGRTRLAAAWADFVGSCTAGELATAEFRETEARVTTALATAAPTE